MERSTSNLRKQQRGVALAATAMWLGALLALTVVAVDVGRLATTATEVQTVADAAAIAGARALINDRTNNGQHDPIAAALAVGKQNTVDGGPAPIVADDIEIGNFEDGTFTPGGEPRNAVRATPSVTVKNIVAGVFGDHETTVEKSAIAMYSGVQSAIPVLPIAVGDCKFQQFETSGNCSALPSLTQVPDPTDNSGWTSLSSYPAGASTVRNFLPAECGGGVEPPVVTVGEQVNVLNGAATSIMLALQTCFNLGIRTFQIPIVSCGTSDKYNQSMEVQGFATVEIKRIQHHAIDLSAICKTDNKTTGGGRNFGTEKIALVR